MNRNLKKAILSVTALAVATLPTASIASAQGRPEQTAAAQTASNVNVVNTPSVKDADAPGRMPFQTFAKASVSAGAYSYTSLVTVPVNQRLVVEYVSGYCGNFTAGGAVGLMSLTPAQDSSGFHYLPKTFLTDVNSVPIRLYVNPGDALNIFVNNPGGSGAACFLSVTGYFVTL